MGPNPSKIDNKETYSKDDGRKRNVKDPGNIRIYSYELPQGIKSISKKWDKILKETEKRGEWVNRDQLSETQTLGKNMKSDDKLWDRLKI